MLFDVAVCRFNEKDLLKMEHMFGWFMREAKKRGMTVSLSDYTLGVGQEQYVDEILADYPEISGSELRFMKKRVSGPLHWELPRSLFPYRLIVLRKIVL